MAGNGQHNPPFNWYDDEYLRSLLLDVAFPPIMGGGGSQTYEPGSTQVQHDPNSIQDIQPDHLQYPGGPLAQGFPAGNTLGYPNAQTSLGVPAASPLPHGNPQLNPAFQNGAYPVRSIYTQPNQTTVGPVPMHEGPLLDQGFQDETTTHRQPNIHPGPNYPTGTLNSPQAQYPGVPPQLTTYQPTGDSPGPNNFRASIPFEAQSNDQGGSDNIPYREQFTKLYKRLGDLLHSNGPSFDRSPWNQLSIELQTALLMVNEVIDNSLGSDQSANVIDGRFQCLLCRPNERRAFKNKGTFRRHVRDQHHPDCLYHCGICYPSDKAEFRRKDKHHEHMRNTHFGQKLTREQLAALTEHLDPPRVCALCHRGVGTWDEFFECLCRHCSISKGNRSQGDSPDNDDSDGDDDDEGHRRHGGARNGHGNGHSHFYPDGNGNSGNMGNGGQPHQFDGYPFENSGAGNGAGSFRNRDAANGKIIPSDQANSQKPAFENTATRSNRPGISQPNPILPGTKHQKESKFDDPRLWVDGFTHTTRTFNTELALRPNSLSWKGHGDLGKQNGEGRLVSDKQSASSPVNKKIQQEFQRLRFFEGVLYENQKQGTFLSYFHETLVILAPVRPIAWSMQDISYLRAELSSEKPPEIPGDHLFYLARGKDHSTSEANLETARRASKRRAHLKVRIRAIAGVLALRAAVSKTPAAAVENSEVGNEIDDAVDNEVGHEANDGWELGIPFPPHASQEEEMKIVTWLIQMLVFLLGMQSKPKVSLMLADDSFGVSWLT